MSVISLLKVDVLQNPAPIDAPYEFEIMFQCFEPLQKDIEWKLTYVGSATSSEYDQELVSALVGPIPVGVNKFTLEGNPPDFSRIPDNEVLGVTVMLLSCSYDGREFVRVGYYVNNEVPEETLNDKPTPKPMRNILSEKPRVTRFAIKWDSEESAPAEFPPDQPEADTVEDDEAAYGAEELAAEEEELAAEDAEGEGATAEGEDAEMGGTEEAAHAKDDDAASDAGSEDLEAESSGEDDEEDEEEAEEEMEMEDGDDKAASGAAANGQQAGQPHADVMVH